MVKWRRNRKARLNPMTLALSPVAEEAREMSSLKGGGQVAFRAVPAALFSCPSRRCDGN
jgi:hypothetical protein